MYIGGQVRNTRSNIRLNTAWERVTSLIWRDMKYRRSWRAQPLSPYFSCILNSFLFEKVYILLRYKYAAAFSDNYPCIAHGVMSESLQVNTICEWCFDFSSLCTTVGYLSSCQVASIPLPARLSTYFCNVDARFHFAQFASWKVATPLQVVRGSLTKCGIRGQKCIPEKAEWDQNLCRCIRMSERIAPHAPQLICYPRQARMRPARHPGRFSVLPCKW